MELTPESDCAATMAPTEPGCEAASEVTEVVGVPVINPLVVLYVTKCAS